MSLQIPIRIPIPIQSHIHSSIVPDTALAHSSGSLPTMKTSKCLFNSGAALRNIFLSNAAACEAPSHLRRLLPTAAALPWQPSATSPPSAFSPVPSHRPFSTSCASQNKVRQQRENLRAQKGAQPVTQDNRPRNYDIQVPWIQVRRDDNSLGPPTRTNDVLRELDIERLSLVLVANARTDPEAPGPEYPICLIVDREVERARRAEKEAARKNVRKVVLKGLELNWAIGPHDLSMKMKQLKQFLTKGYTVQVTLKPIKRRTKKQATLDEAKAVLQAVTDALGQVHGAKETSAREGNLGGMLNMVLQGPSVAHSKEALAATMAAEATATAESPSGTQATEEKPAASG